MTRSAAWLTGSGPAAAWLLVTVLALAGAILTGIVLGELAVSDAVANLGGSLAAVVYATLGALVLRRAGNRIGWVLLGEGAGLAIMCLASAYAIEGLTHPGTFPAPDVAGMLAEWFFVPVVLAFGFMALLFPSGTLPSPRWRPLTWVIFLITALAMIGFLVRPRLVALPAPGGVSLMFPNPWGVRSLGPVLSHLFIGTLSGLAVLLIALLAASFVSLIIRYRAGGQEARQQIKWFALAGVAALACQLAAALAIAANHGASSWVVTASNAVMAFLALFGFPAAITVAILRHGLYAIDVIINRALVYGLLSTGVTATYVGIGTDMTVFPTAPHLVSSARWSPQVRQSAGKRKGSDASGRGNPYLAAALGEAAISAGRTQSFLGARYRRLTRRMPQKKALVATGNSMLTIVHALLSDPAARYQDLGADYYEQRMHARRQARNHVKSLERLGYKLTLQPLNPTPANSCPQPANRPTANTNPAAPPRRRELPPAWLRSEDGMPVLCKTQVPPWLQPGTRSLP